MLKNPTLQNLMLRNPTPINPSFRDPYFWPVGFLVERLDGITTAKRVKDDGFHDVHYLRRMLFLTFSGLNYAQRTLGLHHSDLRMANVMEIHGPAFPACKTSQGAFKVLVRVYIVFWLGPN